ncbi:F-type H+-transporting ATPase subunit epsilon [Paragonimus westermani]|uniref:F-type H+-transporting ATPase subunit epsilon n=1 Tax=Paragonimus westermani TaxID=34504 RepID=A0A5J4N5R1_9TREM|nr:F-type H+-transporting ATPase subunit epsilon [Paragonimus westermani]
MTYWRSAGISYMRFSAICAQSLRNSLKEDFRSIAAKRSGKQIKLTFWKDGKPTSKHIANRSRTPSSEKEA